MDTQDQELLCMEWQALKWFEVKVSDAFTESSTYNSIPFNDNITARHNISS